MACGQAGVTPSRFKTRDATPHKRRCGDQSAAGRFLATSRLLVTYPWTTTDTTSHQQTVKAPDDNVADPRTTLRARAQGTARQHASDRRAVKDLASSEQSVQQHDVGQCLRHGRIDVLTVARPRHAACDDDGLIAEVGHRLHRST